MIQNYTKLLKTVVNLKIYDGSKLYCLQSRGSF